MGRKRNQLTKPSCWDKMQHIIHTGIVGNKNENSSCMFQGCKVYAGGCPGKRSSETMGTQKEIAEKIRSKRADYVLAVKGNQRTLYEEFREYFAEEEFAKK